LNEEEKMARTEYVSLNDQTRRDLPGQFIRLSDGVAHYELAGQRGAPTVVLVHGFSVPYYIWDPPFKALNDAGLQVLRYDIYGRGFSDRPDIRYDLDLSDRQLGELITMFELKLPVNLVGVSMGGAMVVAYNDRHPNRVDRLCLIDPLSEPVQFSGLQRVVLFPLLGELIMRWVGERMFTSQEEDFYRPQRFPEYQEKFLPQMRYRGFKRALLSTIRSLANADIHAPYLCVGKQKHPALLIWGREDHVVSFDLNQSVREMIPYIQFEPIDEAGHIPHYERPEVVNPLLINFLKQEM
jgi:pimeloyl-ACP methyl ester carboxylesterase